MAFALGGQYFIELVKTAAAIYDIADHFKIAKLHTRVIFGL